MIGDVTSSSLGAAIGLRQAQTNYETGLNAVKTTADAEAATVSALMSQAPGGNVTETRGRNLNILV